MRRVARSRPTVVAHPLAARRQPPIRAGYDHFRLERQGALVSRKTLEYYDGMVLPFLAYLDSVGVQRFEHLDMAQARQYRARLATARNATAGRSSQTRWTRHNERAGFAPAETSWTVEGIPRVDWKDRARIFDARHRRLGWPPGWSAPDWLELEQEAGIPVYEEDGRLQVAGRPRAAAAPIRIGLPWVVPRSGPVEWSRWRISFRLGSTREREREYEKWVVNVAYHTGPPPFYDPFVAGEPLRLVDDVAHLL